MQSESPNRTSQLGRYLHVGCGPIKFPGWVNIDHIAWHGPDLLADCQRLDELYEPDSVDLLYSCHHLEHLPYPKGVQRFLKAAHTILKPGGRIRLVVPDLEKIAKAYAAGSDLKFIYGPEFKGHYGRPESRAERFTFWARAWEHTVLFDYDLLCDCLHDAGFAKVERCEFGKSRIPDLRNLDRFQSESLVVESEKQ